MEDEQVKRQLLLRKMQAKLRRGELPSEELNEFAKLLHLDELDELDKSIASIIVGICPKCGSEHTTDCDNPLEKFQDSTVGYCFDCGAYWCLECGYISEKLGKGMECPHWGICGECQVENNYSNEFGIDGLEVCTYATNVSECPKIRNF
jgi:hypothetical protein